MGTLEVMNGLRSVLDCAFFPYVPFPFLPLSSVKAEAMSGSLLSLRM